MKYDIRLGDKLVGHKSSKKNNKNFKKIKLDDIENGIMNYYIEEDDLKELNLLNQQLISIYLYTIADIIFYDATINQIEYLYDKI